MIWFLEKGSDLLICEIRRAEDAYEFEVAGPAGPRTQRYTSPSELIAGYLRFISRFRAQGWRPRTGDIAVLS